MIDILAVCAHPDDLEVCAAGIFAKAKKEGLKTGLVIFTRGESGGYAQKCVREEEAEKAAAILQLDYFAMLDFPDAGMYFSKEAVDALIPHLRKCSPRFVLTLLEEDYHPDHTAVSKITKAACFTAGLKNMRMTIRTGIMMPFSFSGRTTGPTGAGLISMWISRMS